MKMKTFFNELKTYKMSREEKSRIRVALISLSKTTSSAKAPHSSPSHTDPNHYRKPMKSPYGAWSFGFNFRAVGIAVLALLVASTGVSFAAENTLPGDLLYSVKINVNEEVHGALITGSTAKMDWEKDRVVRRVEETETLIKTNKFTPERKVQAEAALKTQIETFATAAAETSVTHPNAVIAATAELEPALKVHQDIIADLTSSADNVSTPAETETILTTVAAGIAATSAQESVAIESTSEKAPEALSELTDEKINDAADAIETSPVVAISAKVDNTAGTDADTSDDSQTTEQTETTPTNQSEKKSDISATEVKPKTDIAPDDAKKDTPSDIAPLKSDIALDVAPMATTMAVIAPTPTPQEILANAKAKLKQAKALREKGEFKEALTLAQDAYKDIVALKLQAKIGTKIKSQENVKEESKVDQTPMGEVKGVQTDNTQTDAKTETKANDTPVDKTTGTDKATGTEKTNIENKTDVSVQIQPIVAPISTIKSNR